MEDIITIAIAGLIALTLTLSIMILLILIPSIGIILMGSVIVSMSIILAKDI